MLIFLIFYTFSFSMAAAAGCSGATALYDVKLSYDKQDDNGTYPEGTKVKAICNSNQGITRGSNEAECRNGIWTPQLGRCYYYCPLSDLLKRNYKQAEPYPNTGEKNEWRKHGTQAAAECIWHDQLGFDGDYMWNYFTCFDGGWRPNDPRYPRCPRH